MTGIEREKPLLLYFCGHGGDCQVILSDDRVVTIGDGAEEYTRFVEQLRASPRLVFVSACQSERVDLAPPVLCRVDRTFDVFERLIALRILPQWLVRNFSEEIGDTMELLRQRACQGVPIREIYWRLLIFLLGLLWRALREYIMRRTGSQKRGS